MIGGDVFIPNSPAWYCNPQWAIGPLRLLSLGFPYTAKHFIRILESSWSHELFDDIHVNWANFKLASFFLSGFFSRAHASKILLRLAESWGWSGIYVQVFPCKIVIRWRSVHILLLFHVVVRWLFYSLLKMRLSPLKFNIENGKMLLLSL